MTLAGLLIRVAKLHLLGEYVSLEELAEDYDDVSSSYNETFRKGMKCYAEKLVENLNINGKERIIDAGCGTGAVAEIIKGRWKDAGITCVDISEGMLRRIQKRADVEIYKKDILEFLGSVEDNSVDIVIAAWSLSYVPHKPFVEEVSRVLKKGGKLGIIVNRKDTLRETRRYIISLLRENPRMLKKLMKVYLPKDSSDMAGMLRRYGFKITFMEDYEKRFEFNNSREAVNFVFSTGALAGFTRCFDEELREKLAEKHPPYIVHRFCMITSKKE